MISSNGLAATRLPDIEDYAQRYPHLATVLRQMLPTLQLVHGPGAGQRLAAMLPADGCDPGAIDPEGPLGDFRIVREIGRGGMGVVYEAEQISLGRRVALKVLPFAAALDARQLQRFKNEAQAAAHLHHTNIVPVYAVGCERGVHYYAMQFIEGQTPGRGDRRVAAERRAGREARRCAERTARSDHTPSAELRPSYACTLRVGNLRHRSLPIAGHAARSPSIDAAVDPRPGLLPHAWPGWASRPPRRWSTPTSSASSIATSSPPTCWWTCRGNLWVTDFGLAQIQGDSRPDHDRRPGGHAPLHEPRAGPGQARAGRPPHRHLFAGRDAL